MEATKLKLRRRRDAIVGDLEEIRGAVEQFTGDVIKAGGGNFGHTVREANTAWNALDVAINALNRQWFGEIE
jgi:hypothetical protein